MQLNKNSLTSRLYRWFYNKNHMPDNLCPYFWKLVTMYVFFIPALSLSFPHVLINKFQKGSVNIFYGIMSYFLLWLFSNVVIATVNIFVSYEDNTYLKMATRVGWLTVSITILVLLAIGLDSLKSRNKANIVSGFIKAKYGKYCPRITWK